MKIRITSILLFLFIYLASVDVNAQNTSNPIFNFSNGIGVVAPDSTFSLNFRFRTQLRAGYTSISDKNFRPSEIESRIRRMRLRFEGFILDPKIAYYIQLSFSRADMDWNGNDNSVINTSPNVLRDAIVIYRPISKLTFTFGQTKLPGNRQRSVSSGQLQFPDRSLVNSIFTIDRDFGLQIAYQNRISRLNYVLKGAVSSGEGRNSVRSDAGLAYTGRIELLPFGKFTNKGDYFEGDLIGETKPKISVAAGYHYNHNATRTAGTIGKDLYESRNLTSFFADFLLKYRGFSLSSEYMNRTTDNPITLNAQNLERIVYVGQGTLFQCGYIFKNNVEIAARYAVVTPYSSIGHKEKQRETIGVGVTKYLKNHKLKLQGQLFYNQSKDLFLSTVVSKNWAPMFQIEIGI